jgi:hypothetical protein
VYIPLFIDFNTQKQAHDEVLCVPPLTPVIQLLAAGDMYHARTKIVRTHDTRGNLILGTMIERMDSVGAPITNMPAELTSSIVDVNVLEDQVNKVLGAVAFGGSLMGGGGLMGGVSAAYASIAACTLVTLASALVGGFLA